MKVVTKRIFEPFGNLLQRDFQSVRKSFFCDESLSLCQKMAFSSFQQLGHSCKIGNMRHPGTVKNQNPHLEKLCKFCLSFRFLYHIQ